MPRYIQVWFARPWGGYQPGDIGTFWDTEAEALIDQRIAHWSSTTLYMDTRPRRLPRAWRAAVILLAVWAILFFMTGWMVWVTAGVTVLLALYLLFVGPLAAWFGCYLARHEPIPGNEG